MKDRNFTLTYENLENLQNFSESLDKDVSDIMNEALEMYFLNVEKKLIEKKLADENSQTNLDFNEFWDDVEI